jgi:hypothetical protein
MLELRGIAVLSPDRGNKFTMSDTVTRSDLLQLIRQQQDIILQLTVCVDRLRDDVNLLIDRIAEMEEVGMPEGEFVES